LDWDYHAPMGHYPMVTIYHFDTAGSEPFANFGWAGIIGTLAGYSNKIGISERYDPLKGERGPFGEPWMYVLRDLLQFTTNLTSSVDYLFNVQRTWGIWLGVGSREDKNLYLF